MSMYCVLCVNSLWCSQNMCDLAWLVSLNKTLLLNRMWGYIMGGARFASHKFYHPLPDHTGAVPTFLETRFFNFPGCRHDTAWAILVRNSASLPCLGWHKGWVHLWKFGGGGGLNVAKRITIPQLPQLPSWITCCMIGIPIQNDKKLSQPQNIPKCRFVLYRSYVQKKAKNTMELHHLFLVP